MSGQNKVKQYVRASEMAEYGLGGKASNASERSLFRPLPFDTCALTMQPFKDPVMAPSGAVFDIVALVPWITTHKTDPTTGEPLTLRQLTKLTFHKSPNGKYFCPITNKEFNDFTHIVAVRTSGHVYSWEAVQELNVKAGNWTDLMTGTPFTAKDIVTIQDPKAPERRNVNSFHYIKTGVKPPKESTDAGIRTDPSMRRVLGQMETERAKDEQAQKKKRERDEEAGVGLVAAEEPKREAPSFTMDGFVAKPRTDTVIPAKRTKKKGHVRLYLSCGTLDITLHADLAPVACENFLTLCKRGYYKDVKLHRLIPGFMVQGGDPTGTGSGGESCWGKPFQDEFVKGLRHSKRGIVSMANAGPNTNNSQFFIMFAKKDHLDNKHTVFGEVVETCLPVLDAIEKIPTDVHQNRPLLDIVILDAAVIFDPFEHLEQESLDELKQAETQAANTQRAEWFSNPAAAYPKPAVVKDGVGKYLAAGPPSADAVSQTTRINFGSAAVTAQKKRPGGSGGGSGFGSLF